MVAVAVNSYLNTEAAAHAIAKGNFANPRPIFGLKHSFMICTVRAFKVAQLSYPVQVQALIPLSSSLM